MVVEKVRKDDTASTFEFQFGFNRVWINGRLVLLLLTNKYLINQLSKNVNLPWAGLTSDSKVNLGSGGSAVDRSGGSLTSTIEPAFVRLHSHRETSIELVACDRVLGFVVRKQLV